MTKNEAIAVTWRQVSAMLAALASMAAVLAVIVTPIFAAEAKTIVDRSIDHYNVQHTSQPHIGAVSDKQLERVLEMLGSRLGSIEKQLNRISDAIQK